MVLAAACSPQLDPRFRPAGFLPELRFEGMQRWTPGRPQALERYRSDAPFVIVVMAAGSAMWEVDGRQHLVRRGDAFCIPTGSVAGGMNRVLDRCELFWLVFEPAGLVRRSAGLAKAFAKVKAARLDVIPCGPVVVELVRRVHYRLRAVAVADEMELAGLLAQVLALVARGCDAAFAAEAGPGADIVADIRARVRRDPGLVPGIAAIAAELGVSRSYLHQLIKVHTGLSPSALVLQVQLELGMELLAAGSPVAEAGVGCGFASSKHFARRFKQALGVSPSRWLREQRVAAAGP